MEGVAVARNVHYVDEAGEHRAAIVSGVAQAGLSEAMQLVDLAVFPPGGIYHRLDVPYSLKHEPLSWHWPERT